MLLGYQLSAVGKNLNEAQRVLKKAETIDPLTPITMGALGFFHMFSDFGKAIESWREWQLLLEKAKSPFLFLCAWLNAVNYNTDESLRIIDQIVKENRGHMISELMTFMKHAILGDKKEALAVITDQLEQDAKWDDLRAHIMAECYALIDEHDHALSWLKHSINYGISNLNFLSESDPFLENIRGDKRFKKLIDEIKYKWENFEY